MLKRFYRPLLRLMLVSLFGGFIPPATTSGELSDRSTRSSQGIASAPVSHAAVESSTHTTAFRDVQISSAPAPQPKVPPANVLGRSARQTTSASTKQVLIYGPTYGGSHDVIHTTPGVVVTVWNAATWASKTTADFEAFDAIVFGDYPDGFSDCLTNPSIWDTAVANRAVWSAAVTGNSIILGTDPELHANDGITAAERLIHQAVQFAADGDDAGLGSMFRLAVPITLPRLQ